MSRKRILIWIRPYGGLRPAPRDTPFGRAALCLKDEGIDLIMASSPQSWMHVIDGTWQRCEPDFVDAVYDRFSARSMPEHYSAMEQQAGRVPRGNPPELIRICTDKIATQRLLGHLPFPPIETSPSLFQNQLSQWESGYLKPRFGGLGRGVRKVEQGDPLPAWGQSAIRGASEPTFLQKAISPPGDMGSLCVRWLTQREDSGHWKLLPPVARVSNSAVANVHQGAVALPAEEVLSQKALKMGEELVLECAQELQNQIQGVALELGVDLLFDEQENAWILEVNSRPSGRLSALTARNPQQYGPIAHEAVLRPLRTLASLG